MSLFLSTIEIKYQLFLKNQLLLLLIAIKDFLKDVKQIFRFHNRRFFKLIDLRFFKTRFYFLSRLSFFFYSMTRLLHF